MKFLISYLLTNGKKKYNPLNLLALSTLRRKKTGLLAKTLSCAKRCGEEKRYSLSLHLYVGTILGPASRQAGPRSNRLRHKNSTDCPTPVQLLPSVWSGWTVAL
jgi:hypothetical protein